ncbi:hypothetical protein [Sulfurimonas sp.]|nr:hypothetical protein [Sulfurimonas sp.]
MAKRYIIRKPTDFMVAFLVKESDVSTSNFEIVCGCESFQRV